MKGSKGELGLPPASATISALIRAPRGPFLCAHHGYARQGLLKSLSATGTRNMPARAAATTCVYKVPVALEGACVRTRCESIWCSCSFFSFCDMNSAKRYASCYSFLLLPAPTGPFPSGLVCFRHEVAEPSSVVIPIQTIGHVASTHHNVLADPGRHTT
jgi:hypothetical protein